MRRAALTALLGVAVACQSSATATPASPAVAATTGPVPQPVRGTVHMVRMLLDNDGYRFEPGYLTVSEGDGVRFVMISGVPHNVAFDEKFMPRAARAQLIANLSLIGARELASPVVVTLDSAFTVSTSGLARGEYLFYCGPHRSLNMHGVITVR